MIWTREPTYEKPDISVRATSLYYEIVASIMLSFLDRRLLNLFRCREGKCFFQRNREHPPTKGEFDKLVHYASVEQKNGRTEDYLFVTSTEEILACAKKQTVEFHGWGSRAGNIERPDRIVIDLDPDPALTFEKVKEGALQVHRSFEAIGLESFALLSGGKGIHVIVPLSRLLAGRKWRSSRGASVLRSPMPRPSDLQSLSPRPSAVAGSFSISFETTGLRPRSCLIRRELAAECRSQPPSLGRSLGTLNVLGASPLPMWRNCSNAQKALN